mmetsp:Transcript_65355/g.121833  ORF Transcript_65355/g.121833 Transcript_65355/m.121833 type:complete len:153 (-) Transcript_65355:65-523(-)
MSRNSKRAAVVLECLVGMLGSLFKGGAEPNRFRDETPFEDRCQEAQRILSKHPDRVPIICAKAARSQLPEIAKNKFLVPGGMLCSEFKFIIFQLIQEASGEGMASDQTIYLFIGSTVPKSTALMSELYEQHKDSDGFLYMTFSAENTLGQTH